jgi:hypothetical protein
VKIQTRHNSLKRSCGDASSRALLWFWLLARLRIRPMEPEPLALSIPAVDPPIAKRSALVRMGIFLLSPAHVLAVVWTAVRRATATSLAPASHVEMSSQHHVQRMTTVVPALVHIPPVVPQFVHLRSGHPATATLAVAEVPYCRVAYVLVQHLRYLAPPPAAPMLAGLEAPIIAPALATVLRRQRFLVAGLVAPMRAAQAG